MTSSAVVGSSAMTSARRQASARGDQQALALAAGELMRIALERGLGIGQLHAPQQLDQRECALPSLGAGRGVRRMPAHDLQQLGADLEHRD